MHPCCMPCVRQAGAYPSLWTFLVQRRQLQISGSCSLFCLLADGHELQCSAKEGAVLKQQ